MRCDFFDNINELLKNDGIRNRFEMDGIIDDWPKEISTFALFDTCVLCLVDFGTISLNHDDFLFRNMFKLIIAMDNNWVILI